MEKTKNIKQGAMIKASPHEVYEALMDSKKHAKFTGEPAKISRKVGGSFTAYSKYISGKNMQLVKDKKIVQSWRGAGWPKGHFSVVTFLLKPTKGGTKLLFSHKGVPVKEVKDITSGWKKFYWEPLKKMLEK
jgi:activator of HSP90 ATPase